MKKQITLLTGTVIDEETPCRLHDICRIYNITSETVREMVTEGVVTPGGDSPEQWRFDYLDIQRIHTSIRLQRDLRINLPGCALVLDLLEELESLRRQ